MSQRVTDNRFEASLYAAPDDASNTIRLLRAVTEEHHRPGGRRELEPYDEDDE
jgi:hypothetical protein